MLRHRISYTSCELKHNLQQEKYKCPANGKRKLELHLHDHGGRTHQKKWNVNEVSLIRVAYQQFVIVVHVPMAACSVRAVAAVRAGFKVKIESSLAIRSQCKLGSVTYVSLLFLNSDKLR